MHPTLPLHSCTPPTPAPHRDPPLHRDPALPWTSPSASLHLTLPALAAPTRRGRHPTPAGGPCLGKRRRRVCVVTGLVLGGRRSPHTYVLSLRRGRETEAHRTGDRPERDCEDTGDNKTGDKTGERPEPGDRGPGTDPWTGDRPGSGDRLIGPA